MRRARTKWTRLSTSARSREPPSRIENPFAIPYRDSTAAAATISIVPAVSVSITTGVDPSYTSGRLARNRAIPKPWDRHSSTVRTSVAQPIFRAPASLSMRSRHRGTTSVTSPTMPAAPTRGESPSAKTVRVPYGRSRSGASNRLDHVEVEPGQRDPGQRREREDRQQRHAEPLRQRRSDRSILRRLRRWRPLVERPSAVGAHGALHHVLGRRARCAEVRTLDVRTVLHGAPRFVRTGTRITPPLVIFATCLFHASSVGLT